MTKEDALEKARVFVEQKGWPWEGTIRARRSRRWWIGSYIWEVHTNADYMGCNAWVTIDDNLEEVISSVYYPR